MKYAIADVTKAVILGRQGENEVTTIKFPIAEWLHDFDTTGTFMLLNVRPTENDELAYPCVVTNNDEFVYWVVKEADLVYKGIGRCELIYTVNGQIAKSVIYSTNVLESIENGGETPPEPYQDWVNDVLEKCDEAIAGSARKINDVVDANGNSVADTNRVAHLPKVGQAIEIYDSENHRLAYTINEIVEMYDNSVSLTFLQHPIINLYRVIEQGVDKYYIFYTMFERHSTFEEPQYYSIYYINLNSIQQTVAGIPFGYLMTDTQRIKLNNINVSDITQNTQARHTHSNKDTLDKLSEVSGALNYNGIELVTKAVNDLLNYYTKTEVNNLIGSISSLSFEVVQVLPTEDIKTNVIYLVPKSSTGTNDGYDEYIYLNNSWELIGNTDIDLTGYATEEWVNEQDFAQVEDIPSLAVKEIVADEYYDLKYDTLEILNWFNNSIPMTYNTFPVVYVEKYGPNGAYIYYTGISDNTSTFTLYRARYANKTSLIFTTPIGVFSENSYTTAEKTKLASLENGKMIEIVDPENTGYSIYTGDELYSALSGETYCYDGRLIVGMSVLDGGSYFIYYFAGGAVPIGSDYNCTLRRVMINNSKLLSNDAFCGTFITYSEQTKLAGIEAGAQVNDVVTDVQMLQICSTFADFITDGTYIIGINNNTAIAF